MSRPWHIWAVFGLCISVVLGAMGWASDAVLKLDAAQAEARRQAAIDENVQLALWRMDSAAAPLIARENARPYFAYSPLYPAERAYTRMFAEIDRGEVLIPSPLLTQGWPYILVHFQFAPGGELTSPQVPTGNTRDLAEGHYVKPDRIVAARRRLDELASIIGKEVLLAALPATDQPPSSAPVRMPVLAEGKRQSPTRVSRRSRSAVEQQQRASNVVRLMTAQQRKRSESRLPASDVREGLIQPVWVDSALVLARRVSVNGAEYIQGCWLDWPAIRTWLIESVRDLLPAASVEPAESDDAEAEPRLLAALPVRLIPGDVPADAAPGLSPIRLSLLVAWACVLVAAVAVGVLLRGTVTLSERRGAFVSAVTHELRTPLTTFRMYTEMLAEGMVPDEAKRLSYLNTLQTEADRLSHLVENVLAYARLERGRAGGQVESLTLRELLDRVTDRLNRRAQQADMELITEAQPAALDQHVKADASAVEQILFNLVDNACKYAAAASDRRIHLQADHGNGSGRLRVRDHGPGISKRDARRLFRPFSKSARDAAGSAPGVGLGLALSRRLARAMGGDLSIDGRVTAGACFVLDLPAGQPPA